MYSILDIDLDYFNTCENPVQRFDSLLNWANHPVDFIVEKHYEVLKQWQKRIGKIGLSSPTHIMHVDEHHDMMDEQAVPNIANVVVHALRRWPQCRVHWLVEDPIDSPEMWLSDSTWEKLSPRFSKGAHKPRNWPKPNLVSVCTSPDFVSTRDSIGAFVASSSSTILAGDLPAYAPFLTTSRNVCISRMASLKCLDGSPS